MEVRASRKRYLLIPGLLACTALLGGCGSDGADGLAGAVGLSAYETAVANGYTGTEAEWLASLNPTEPETCSVCHSGAGADHQANYNDYLDTTFAVTIDSVASVANGDGTFTSTMLFTVTKDGQPYTAGLNGLAQKRYYAVTYDNATSTFGGAAGAEVISYGTPTLVNAGTGQYSVTNATATFAPETGNAMAYVYIADGELESGSHYTLYDDVANAGLEYGNVDLYVSTANVDACEKCHGKPYMKHGYRAAEVAGLPDFAACKACHLDDKAGSHQGWQLLVDDPAAYAAQDGVLTAEQKTTYAYKRNVMNDVHMSHAMEFAYPQSMANCATCHEGKLNAVLTDDNFTLTTCKSCHPMTGSEEYGTADRALNSLIPDGHVALTADVTCKDCHKNAGGAKGFNKIHTGYNAKIYADAAGTRYSDVFTVSIDEASLSSNVLTIKFSAAEAPDVAGLAVTDITPTVMVGLYGYDTKDFLVGSHGKTIDSDRDLEYVVGATHARFTTVSAADGSWEVTANLSAWADKIADGTVKRAEIAVMPALKNADGDTLALNAPSKTFDLTANAFVNYFNPIVKVEGCNACHDALATTFHSGNRGGNIVVCRLCHVTLNGGSHLEMQSRSIDSYVHAIHSLQPFDIGDIDFTDAVEELHYDHHIESTYPNFTVFNCESCHNAGTYEVPDQSKSLPGVLSKSDAVTTMDRSIGTVASVVVGPGSRACGSCHRAKLINEDHASELASLNQHTKTGGYTVEATTGVLDSVIESIMGIFK